VAVRAPRLQRPLLCIIAGRHNAADWERWEGKHAAALWGQQLSLTPQLMMQLTVTHYSLSQQLSLGS